MFSNCIEFFLGKGVATIVFNKTYNKNRDNLLAQKQSIVKIGQLFAMVGMLVISIIFI